MKEDKISQVGEPEGESLQSPPNSPRRILVVEDEPDIRQLNVEVLKNSGYVVDAAEDGHAGWQALHSARHSSESYDLLITDHNMPGLTGLALVKKLRAAHMALPIILATGTLPTEDFMDRYPWLQSVTTLPKPYSAKQLLETVEAALRISDEDRAASNCLRSMPGDSLQL